MACLIRLDQWLGRSVSGGFSRREGGVSQGVHHSLNVGFHVGDIEGDVQENRALLACELNIEPSEMWFGEQVHGHAVATVSRESRSDGPYHSIALVDGLVTSDEGIALGVLTADCVPLLFADAVQGVIGVAHAGWRGATSGVVTQVVSKMMELGAKTDSIRVAMGPAIRACCYEVDTPVIRAAHSAYDRMGGRMPSWGKSAKHLGAVMMDLPKICRDELISLGIHETHILDTSICTSCMPGFFSFRRDQGKTGRQAGLIRLGR